MAYIEINRLKKYFNVSGGTLHAVDDISLSIESGETLGVVGESGCGKSTLGKTILRLTEPTSGEVLVDGKNICAIPYKKFKEMRTEMQMIYQDPFSSLDPRKTVMQLISEPLKIHKLYKNKVEMQQYVESLMQIVGIDFRFAHAYPHEMDGGRRQRVGIARALALNPKFIVCDEPVSALDVSIQAQVLNLLQDLQQERHLTYMFITHDMSVVKHISTNICVMYLGKVVELSPSKDLFQNTIHPYSKALLSAIPEPSLHNRRERRLISGEITSPIDPKECCRFAPRCPYASEECFTSSPALTEISNKHFVACHKAKEFI
ncbi:MAG: ATP-binding cassette domain-containing protein [Oscillospiraceae bacterium]|nr:ATP-binding cassette domain-containing protein [Oscillospiraceae bacterium]